MSIHVMSLVWKDITLTSHADLLVMLALADFSNDDGDEAWPSLKTLTKKCRMSERGLRYTLRRLEAEKRIVSDVGSGRHTTKYRIILGGHPVPPSTTSQGHPVPLRGAKLVPLRGAYGDTPNKRSIIDPSIEPGITPALCNGIEITFEMVKSWLKVWIDSGSDYSEQEAKSAFLAMQASGWMWGRNRVQDPRAAIERQIQTDRNHHITKNGSNNSLPLWRQIESLQDDIEKHVANSESTYHKQNCTDLEKADLRSKRIKLRELKATK